MKTCHRLSTLIAILSIVASCSHQPSMAELEKGFIHPPDSAKPHVWWHWLNGNVSQEGISRDLEAMAEQGIGGVSIFNLREQADPGPVIYGSAAWQRLVDHTFAEAKRLGLQLSFQNCGGWATSGGPWVSPDQAMKKLVYGKVRVKGPQKFSGSLPRAVGFDGYYRDVVILAYAQHDQGPSRMRTALAGIFCDNEILNKELMADENIITEAEIAVGTDPVSLTFEFQSPFRVSSLFLKRTNQAWEGARFCGLSVSPDNRKYRDVFKENPIPNEYQTIEFAPIEARFFKLTFSGFDELVTTGKSPFKVPEVLFLAGEKNNALPALDDLSGFNRGKLFRRNGPSLPSERTEAGSGGLGRPAGHEGPHLLSIPSRYPHDGILGPSVQAQRLLHGCRFERPRV